MGILIYSLVRVHLDKQNCSNVCMYVPKACTKSSFLGSFLRPRFELTILMIFTKKKHLRNSPGQLQHSKWHKS